MDQHCRLCLEHCQVDDCRTMLDEEFRQTLLEVFTFTLEMNPQLSTRVCGQCFVQITDFHAYGVRVRANQKQLLLRASEPVLNDLFEMVKVEASEKEQLLEEGMANDLETTKNDSLMDTRISTKGPVVMIDCPGNGVEEREEAGLDSKAPQKPHKLHRRKLTKSIAKSALANTVRKQRRNDETQRIDRFFKMDCEICSTEMGSFSNLQLHYRKAHNSIGYIRCCDKVLTRRAQLVEHICVHEGVLRCDVCQKSYKCSRSLNLHKQNSHSTDEEKPFKCNKCHQSYPKKHLLTAHLVRHVQERCAICEKVLSSSQALKVHVAQVHGDDSNQICATCGKEFRTKRAMDRHIQGHLGLDVVDKVQCHICEKWFNGKYNLKKHIRFIHIEEGQDFQCDICKQKYPNTRALSYHKQRVHVEEKFECEYCGKRFKRKIYLKEHIARHTGQPLYACDVCDATFNSNGNLYAHRRSKHAECRDPPATTNRRQRPNSSEVVI